MNKWWYRTVGTVGVAGGFMLLTGGAAQAADGTGTDAPQPLTGAVQRILAPYAGLLGPLGMSPSTVVPSHDAVPGVVSGPVIVPARPAQARPAQARPAQARPAQARPAQARPAQGRPAQPRANAEAHGEQPRVLPAPAGLPVGPAASVVSPLAPAGSGGAGDLLSGNLLSGNLLGGGLLGDLPTDDVLDVAALSADQMAAVIGDEMVARQPELFSSELPLLGGLGGLPVLTGAANPGVMPAGGTPMTAPAASSTAPARGKPVAPPATGGRSFTDDGRPVAGDETGF